MSEEEPQAITHASANAATNGNGTAASTQGPSEAALAQALTVFYALPPDVQAEFLRHVAPRHKSPVRTLGIFKEGPLHDLEVQADEARKRQEAMEREAIEDDAE